MNISDEFNDLTTFLSLPMRLFYHHMVSASHALIFSFVFQRRAENSLGEAMVELQCLIKIAH